MSFRWNTLALVLVVSPTLAQQPAETTNAPTAPVFTFGDSSAAPTILQDTATSPGNDSGFLSGTHSFPNFINFMSNPLLSIDPRAVTAIYPLAAGLNAVFVPEHVELGVVYGTTIATERDFDANGLIVKLTLRY
jgi:hypothetical protein